MRVCSIAIATLSLLSCGLATVSAEPERTEVRFSTAGGLVPGAGGRFVDGPTEMIGGTLYLPSGAGPFSAVVLSHGCGGVSPTDTGWATALSNAGYAVLTVDSFRPRGISRTCENLFAFNAVRRLPDVYGALKWLSAEPSFNRQRIALMGFSHGGWVTVLASETWAKERFGGGESFRAFFPFYPLCSPHHVDRATLTAPMRIHIGSADDYTPAAPCKELVDELKSKGLDARLTVYEGAHHSFDNPSLANFIFNPKGMSFTGCASMGNSSTDSILGPYDMAEIRRCTNIGVHLGHHQAATEAARRNVLAELRELDGPIR